MRPVHVHLRPESGASGSKVGRSGADMLSAVIRQGAFSLHFPLGVLRQGESSRNQCPSFHFMHDAWSELSQRGAVLHGRLLVTCGGNDVSLFRMLCLPFWFLLCVRCFRFRQLPHPSLLFREVTTGRRITQRGVLNVVRSKKDEFPIIVVQGRVLVLAAFFTQMGLMLSSTLVPPIALLVKCAF